MYELLSITILNWPLLNEKSYFRAPLAKEQNYLTLITYRVADTDLENHTINARRIFNLIIAVCVLD